MTTNFSKTVNDINYSNIQKQIMKKKGSSPYFATIADASSVLTDYDVFPYNRWFRGVAQSTKPIVAEREAGWRPIHNNCYDVQYPSNYKEDQYPNHCIQGSCSTIYPCNPAQDGYFNKTAKDISINNSCIVKYR